MKKRILGSMVAAGLLSATTLRAMSLASDGSGQVLLFPYYTVNGGNQTLVSIVNGTDRGKATRLFFREGRNARVVMELSIYLAPFDAWTGALFDLSPSEGPANLVTVDNSCTVPALRTNTSLPALVNGNRYAPFSNAAYTGTHNDAGSDDPARTREGYFELIEMGEVLEGSRNTLAAIRHNSNGVPANCAQLEEAWAPGGYWQSNSMTDIAPPGGGLYGTVYLVDVLGGTMQAYAADAIDDFSGWTLHLPPGLGQPTLADANTGNFIATISAEVFLDGRPLTLSYPQGARAIDAVSALFMAESIHNDYVTSSSVGGAAEWVITFPTKHFYTDISGSAAIAPFTSVFAANTNQGSAPEDFGVDAWTRAGVKINCIPPYDWSGCVVGVPPPLVPERLNWASNVVGFMQGESIGTGSSILGSTLSISIDPFDSIRDRDADDGAARMAFWAPGLTPDDQRLLRPDVGGRRLRGLPVQGFWVTSYTNGQLTPGVLSNYSDAVRHQTKASLNALPL